MILNSSSLTPEEHLRYELDCGKVPLKTEVSGLLPETHFSSDVWLAGRTLRKHSPSMVPSWKASDKRSGQARRQSL